LCFDRLLGFLDAARDHPRFDRHAFGHAQAEHQRLMRFGRRRCASNRFERKEKIAKSRDRPGALRGRRNWLSMRRASWRSVPRMCSPPSATTSSCLICIALQTVEHRLPLVRRHLKDFSFVLEKHLGMVG